MMLQCSRLLLLLLAAVCFFVSNGDDEDEHAEKPPTDQEQKAHEEHLKSMTPEERERIAKEKEAEEGAQLAKEENPMTDEERIAHEEHLKQLTPEEREELARKKASTHEIEEETKGDVNRAKELTGWGPTDLVTVYYGEFLLAQWVLDKAPWNAYHSGLAFVNNRTQQKVLFDYTPEDTSSVMGMLVPQLGFESIVKAALLGSVTFTWKDQARMKFIQGWPDKYSNIVRLGELNGKIFNQFADWVVDHYLPTHTAFQPIEVAKITKGGKQSTVMRSRMCHDFVTDSLWTLHDFGVKMRPKVPIFRDHIIMYASDIDPVNEMADTRKGKRMWLRYLRILHMFMEQIKEQFTYARNALIIAWKLDIPVFLHDQHVNNMLKLQPPFLNYCYMPLAIPPAKHDAFTADKLCALGLTANASNVTAPWPLGPLMAIESKIDNSNNLVALVLTAFSALLAVGFGASKDKVE